MNPLYVGIDVSSKSNVVFLMLPDGGKHSNFSVANSLDGSSQMVKRILSAITSHSLDTVVIGLEATSVYGDNLVYFLREDASLAPFNRKMSGNVLKSPADIAVVSFVSISSDWISVTLTLNPS